MLQSSLPTVICDTGFTDRQPEHLPKMQSSKCGMRNQTVGYSTLIPYSAFAIPHLKW